LRKRILHIIPTLDRSGAEKQLVLLAKGLPIDEFDVHVCALTRGGPLKAELDAAGVPSRVIGKRWKLDPIALAHLWQHIRKLQPDLIQTWIFAADSYGRLAGMLAGRSRLVASLRCVDPWKGEGQLLIDRWLARHTAAIVANSPGVRQFYLEKGLPGDKLEVIVNGVPPAAASRFSREEALAVLGVPPAHHVVGLVGRLARQKRIKDAIWAADLLKVIRDDVHLVLLGDGPQRHELERFRDQVEIADRVHFLGHRGDVPDLLPHFDLLWSTSEYEGQSNSILEAMAAGLPVVATDILGTRDLVVPGQTGVLVAVGDRAALAQATHQLLDQPALRQQWGAAAIERVRERFNVEQMVARYAGLYRRMLRGAS